MSTHAKRYITISYKLRIFLEKSWQTLAIKAFAVHVTPGMAVVTQVIAIDGRDPSNDTDLEVVVSQAGVKKLLRACAIQSRADILIHGGGCGSITLPATALADPPR